MNTVKVTAFRWVPPIVQGLVRDLRVRWALEEAGLSYEEQLIGPEEQRSDSYRRLQPFGQVPVYEEGGLSLFESGAIVLHIAERCEKLLPIEGDARARAKTWMFAALDSVGQIENLTELDLFYADQDWAKQRRPTLVESVTRRLTDLARWLDKREYLDGGFTAADLLMTAVLRTIRHTSLVSDIPVLRAYQARCESRAAFQKALKDHMAPFAKHKAAVNRGAPP